MCCFISALMEKNMDGQNSDTFAYTANSRYNMGIIKTKEAPI